ncbi:hypothetical protein HYV43_03445 [Candidatus Micrarchaeota archaeon]|nr:hypothetical protein [Candidatus Micrarchaeota archaeon]
MSGFAAAANASVLGGSLSLAALKYVPYPAEPGSYVDLWLDVYASEAQAGLQCQLDPQFPFSLDANEDAARTLDYLPGRQGWLLKYKVRVAPDAILGDNKLSFGCKSAGSPFIGSNFSIYIQPQSGDLALDAVSSVPEKLAPGQSGLVSLTLRNFGPTEFKNVRIVLNLTDPFVPLRGGSERRVDRIVAGASQTVQFDLLATTGAESKAYRVPVSVAFEDAAGTKYSLKDVVGLQVGAEPLLDVQLDSSTLLRPNALGKVSLKLVNSGSEEVKFLTARLEDAASYQSAGANRYYVGTVASDDFETLDFDVFALKDDPVLDVALEFRDATNQLYQKKVQVAVPTYTDDEIARFQLEPKAETNWWLVIVALAVLAYAGRWAWGKWGRKK